MKKILLCVMDGVGISTNKIGNALLNAKTPTIDNLMEKYGYKEIQASGKFVGLPDGQMGNSEVGHLTIGAGRIVYQPLTLIDNSICDKSFFSKKELINSINHAKKNKSKLHIMGMLSDGGVHSSINHIIAILEVLKKEKFDNVYFHVFTDGRDTYYKSAVKYLDILRKKIEEYKIGKIATISGRYYAMDRDKRYDRLQKAYNAICFGIGNKCNDYKEAIENNYKNEVYDEFIIPTIINEGGTIDDNDSVIWANFRPDRARELLHSIIDEKFDYFERKKLKNINLTTFMWVDNDLKSNIIFKNEKVENSLGVYLSKKGFSQLRIAETEKYAHVTYFFDGLNDLDLTNEKKILIPSKKVKTYDLYPEMSAVEITENLLKEMDKDYDFIFMNFANADMVGHTGNYDATIEALETLDSQIERIYQKSKEKDYLLIITSDHGNCENMIDSDNKIVTKHTLNKVPFIVCDKINYDVEKLSDIAPFVLNLMGQDIPKEMK